MAKQGNNSSVSVKTLFVVYNVSSRLSDYKE